VDELALVAALQVVEDGSVVEVGQVDHVVALLELRRVHLTDLSRREGFFLQKKIQKHLILLLPSNMGKDGVLKRA
jgi:hypothetical protein